MNRFVILLCLFATLLPPARAQEEGVSFAVNGQACDSGQCALNVATYGSGRPLRLNLTGGVPMQQAVEVSLVLVSSAAKGARGVTLEFDGCCATPSRVPLRISPENAPKLWRAKSPLLLHLGDLNPTATEYIDVVVRLSKSRLEVARLHIQLEGLRAPGEQVGWELHDPFATMRPIIVPIYPNPVKEGLIHVDLQAIPSDKSGEVSIIDLLGSTVYSTHFTGGNLVQCPSEDLSKGIYFLRVDVDGSVLYTGRLVVDK